MKIPMVDLAAQLADTAPLWRPALERCLASGWFILGEEAAAFEREFASAMGARWAVAVGSGTSALEFCLRSVGLRSDRNQVVVPALTSLFTAQAILAAGGRPRFADVDPETLLLDPGDAARQITPNTAALLPVHLYGQPCDLKRLSNLAREAGLALVQDACQAHGARLAGRPLAAYSPFVAYSFYPTKNLGCLGDGGAVVTNSRRVADLVRLLRDGGRRGGQVSRIRTCHSRLSEIQACFLRAFLPMLDEWNRRRARLCALYEESLAGCEDVRPLRRVDGAVHHLFVIRARQRNRLRQYLFERGILTAVHYPVPLHLQPAFREFGCGRGSLPNAERACKEILSLPLWPAMSESQVLEVVEAIRSYYAGRRTPTHPFTLSQPAGLYP